VAAAIVCIGALGWWARWPDAVPVALLAFGVVAGGIYVLLSRRERPLSDSMAAAIDADARLGGELRSAAWFSGQPAHDEWAELHLARAAERLDTIDWTSLYPRVRAARSRATTFAMACAALAIAFALPARTPASHPVENDPAAVRDAPAPQTPLELLPPELQKQLADLLAAAEAGTLARSQVLRSDAERRAFLERLGQLRDPQALKDLARSLDKANTADTLKELNALADRVKKAAGMSAKERELAKALDDLARKLNAAASAEQSETARTQAGESGEPADEAETGLSSSIDEASIDAVKEAQAAAGGAGVVMMGQQDAAGASSTPGFGIGGGNGSMTNDAQAAALEGALRQELIEASRDSAGANVEADVRRKTEQGDAAVGFTGTASTRSDTARAAGAPPVPEARRSDVQRYFIRKQ
jgi:hypothetical protein